MGKAVRWTFSARRTRRERKHQRSSIKLWDAAITKATQERYFLGLQKLLPVLSDASSLIEIDMATSNWIQRCWENGDPLHGISEALCGLHHYEPWTKRHLPLSWKMFGIWRKLESPDRAPPVTREIIYAWSFYAIDHCDFIFAGLLLLGFFALLRTGEILQVTAADLLISNNQGTWAYVTQRQVNGTMFQKWYHSMTHLHCGCLQLSKIWKTNKAWARYLSGLIQVRLFETVSNNIPRSSI